jgi:hypothetical protein
MSSRFKSLRVQKFDALPALNLEPDTLERELKNPRSQNVAPCAPAPVLS